MFSIDLKTMNLDYCSNFDNRQVSLITMIVQHFLCFARLWNMFTLKIFLLFNLSKKIIIIFESYLYTHWFWSTVTRIKYAWF